MFNPYARNSKPSDLPRWAQCELERLIMENKLLREELARIRGGVHEVDVDVITVPRSATEGTKRKRQLIHRRRKS